MKFTEKIKHDIYVDLRKVWLRENLVIGVQD